jgi:uncharacterized membrane protein YebE (DUF533 family)
MFNPEKILGMVLKELGGGSRRRRKSSLLSGITSGGALMTAIGLGVGAFEILKEKQVKGQPPPLAAGPPPLPGRSGDGPPPLVRAAVPPAPPPQPSSLDPGAMAVRMVQVMVAAAHADGTLDQQEEAQILDRLSRSELSQEEKMFFLEELHHPRSIADLTAGINDPATAKAIYLLAVNAIAIDTQEERNWLDELAKGLRLSQAMQVFLEKQQG